MPLSVGDKLGPYEILAPIGAGGMGEVYRARDARLSRDVAIKVYAGLGEKDQVFDWLDRAYKDRSYYLAVYLTTDARLDSLRSDPRFAELRKKIGFPN
jgi:serine/threonine protein kinase